MNNLTTRATRDERVCKLFASKPWSYGSNSSLRGHASVAFSGAWIVHRVPIFRTHDGSLSAGTPSIPELDSERIKVRDGKERYAPLISFETATAPQRWQEVVPAALNQGGIGDAPELPLGGMP